MNRTEVEGMVRVEKAEYVSKGYNHLAVGSEIGDGVPGTERSVDVGLK